MLVTFIFTFEMSPLPPQHRFFQIDLKVWGSSGGWCLGGWKIRGGRRGGTFCVGRTGFPLIGEHGKRPSPTDKTKYFKNQPYPSD